MVGDKLSPRPCGRGGFKPYYLQPTGLYLIVPARVGGVDLSDDDGNLSDVIIVPARVGGVDLSYSHDWNWGTRARPRPCGRGGFKHTEARRPDYPRRPRPCGRGGFKLKKNDTSSGGGGPRPCGRGGFKPWNLVHEAPEGPSPPVWAGWI